MIPTTTRAEAATAALNGCWNAIEACLGGVRLPDDALPHLALRIANTAINFGGEEGIVSVDDTLSPAALDIVATHGRNRGRLVPAIFERAGGMLRICCDLSGTSRPRRFTAPAGSRLLLVTYRRVAKRR